MICVCSPPCHLCIIVTESICATAADIQKQTIKQVCHNVTLLYLEVTQSNVRLCQNEFGFVCVHVCMSLTMVLMEQRL